MSDDVADLVAKAVVLEWAIAQDGDHHRLLLLHGGVLLQLLPVVAASSSCALLLLLHRLLQQLLVHVLDFVHPEDLAASGEHLGRRFEYKDRLVLGNLLW